MIINQNNIQFCGIYDGHGGDQAAQFSARYLHNEIFNHANVFEQPFDKIKEMIETAFKITDKKYIDQEKMSSFIDSKGCTATVMVQYKNNLYFANAGDSRSIVINKNFKATQVTIDHKPDLPQERKRIQEYGSTVIQVSDDCPRVAGMLAVSRAIGDSPFKGCGVISTPDVFYQDANDVEYIIMGCDGLWDVLTNDQIGLIVSWFISFKNNQQPVIKTNDQDIRLLFNTVSAYCKSKDMNDDIVQSAEIQLDKVLRVGFCENLNEIKINQSERFTPKHLAAILVRLAVSIGSIDNVSVIVGIKQ